MAGGKNRLEDLGFKEEIAEDFLATHYGGYVKTGFPMPKRRLRLIYESQAASLEHTYFWFYNAAVQDFGFGDVIKTVDTFSASENSSFWGMTEQRKGIQQDRASQYLATIGKMIKDMFQIVREIRILKERLGLYEGAKKGKQADDIALKGYWVDLVEGGTRQQANIYTMAQQLGFGSLPDLFFSIYIQDEDTDVTKAVDTKAGEFNDKVKEVLKRKLATYMAWRKQTYSELKARERFTLRYLRQHWAVIRMYISWIKPYLRNVQKLQAPDAHDRNPELISSFEGAVMEIEFLARRGAAKDRPAATILATFTYRVKPRLEFHADGYQHRGAAHVGRVEVSLRSYGWSEEHIKKYLEYREQETLELLAVIDQSVRDALDALGDELKKYLQEAGEDVEFEKKAEEKKEEKEPKVNLFEPFTALFGGFRDMFMMPIEPVKDMFSASKEKKKDTQDWRAAGLAAAMSFQMYKNYKKSHGMPAW